MSSKRDLAIIAGILAVGVVLRLEYLRELSLTPFANQLLLDAEWYHQAALQILAGEALSPGEAYFRPPLYPMFLAAIYKLFGDGLWAPRVTQMLLGLLNVVVLWRIALLVHGPRAALVTAALAATYGMFIYFEAEVLTASLGVLLSCTGFWLLLEGDRRSSPVWLFGGGATLGLASLAHGTVLVAAGVAVAWSWFRGSTSVVARVLATSAVALGLALPVGLVAARNLAVANEWVPIAAQGGINFYIGNNALADGKSALAPGFAEAGQVLNTDGRYRDTMEVAARTLAERTTGRALTAGEVSRHWFGEAWSWIRDEPVAASRLMIQKAFFFGSGFEISNNRDLHDQARRFTPILSFFLWQSIVLLPLAGVGILRGTSERRAKGLLVGAILAYAVAIVAFFVCARFRQPAMAWLLPFAGAGIVKLFDDFVSRERTPIMISAVVLALLAMVSNPWLVRASRIADVTTATDAPFHRYNLAVLYESRGDLDLAIEEYRQIADAGVPDPRVFLNLGNALAQTGRLAEARDAYLRSMRIAPDFEVPARSNLGIVAMQERNWSEAIRQFEECLQIDPVHANSLMGLASATLQAGRFDESISVHRRALRAGVGNARELHRSLAAVYLEVGLLDESVAEAQATLAIDPADVVAIVTLAKIAAERGEEDEAMKWVEQARSIAPGPAVERAVEDVMNRLP